MTEMIEIYIKIVVVDVVNFVRSIIEIVVKIIVSYFHPSFFLVIKPTGKLMTTSWTSKCEFYTAFAINKFVSDPFPDCKAC